MRGIIGFAGRRAHEPEAVRQHTENDRRGAAAGRVMNQERANPARRSDPGGTIVSGEVGWKGETDQGSQRKCQTSRGVAQPPLFRSEIDTGGWTRYRFA